MHSALQISSYTHPDKGNVTDCIPLMEAATQGNLDRKKEAINILKYYLTDIHVMLCHIKRFKGFGD